MVNLKAVVLLFTLSGDFILQHNFDNFAFTLYSTISYIQLNLKPFSKTLLWFFLTSLAFIAKGITRINNFEVKDSIFLGCDIFLNTKPLILIKSFNNGLL